MTKKDLIIADLMFECFTHKLKLISGWKRTKRNPLEDWQLEENIEVTDQRGFLERRLGDVKCAFDLLKLKYRGRSRKELKLLIDVVFALDNIKQFEDLVVEKILQLNRTEWSYFLSSKSHWLFYRQYIPLNEEV